MIDPLRPHGGSLPRLVHSMGRGRVPVRSVEFRSDANSKDCGPTKRGTFPGPVPSRELSGEVGGTGIPFPRMRLRTEVVR